MIWRCPFNDTLLISSVFSFSRYIKLLQPSKARIILLFCCLLLAILSCFLTTSHRVIWILLFLWRSKKSFGYLIWQLFVLLLYFLLQTRNGILQKQCYSDEDWFVLLKVDKQKHENIWFRCACSSFHHSCPILFNYLSDYANIQSADNFANTQLFLLLLAA
jgi:hypothetical protein